ncbi:MAG TPA: PIN domain-containing protein [Solirubrobacterales bacterium]|jgi:tRNA(fMet)-specific endonuclease VapC|nr:PIN domain-containing protein [Solirubrobacterales bacterium]
MAVLIDTSVLVSAERRWQSLDQAIGDADRAISVITASELLHGVHRAQTGAVRARRSAFVEHVISAIEPLPVTTAITRAHAEVWADLENDGNLIGAHDLWIAATALSHGMDVATANPRDFERVPGLDVVPV